MAYGSVLTDVVQSSTSGTPPQFNDGNGTQIGTLCRAWVNFNGTGTVAIRASFNVSSITDNGTGNYRVNFTTAMPDANYSVAVACALTANYPVLGTGTPGTSGVAINIANQTASTQAAADSASVFVQIFR